MSRTAGERIADILEAVAKCRHYREHLVDADPLVAEMAFDAILRNISIIGESANHLPAEITGAHPEIDWPAIVGMRNILVHQYFVVDAKLVERVLDRNLEPLAAVLRRHTTN